MENEEDLNFPFVTLGENLLIFTFEELFVFLNILSYTWFKLKFVCIEISIRDKGGFFLEDYFLSHK